jgi:hypothetical protein
MSDGLAQILFYTGLALAPIGLIIFALALFADAWRRRGTDPRRCPKCWYDLSGVTLQTCSECGYSTSDERLFHKRRRRWFVAMFGLLVLLLGAAGVASPVFAKDRGALLEHAPEWLLLKLCPDPGNELYTAQSNSAYNFRRNAPTPPVGWPLAAAEELHKRYIDRTLSVEARRRVGERITYGFTVAKIALPWTVGPQEVVYVTISPDLMQWYFFGLDRLSGRISCGPATQSLLGGLGPRNIDVGEPGTQWQMRLGTLPPGTHTLDFELELRDEGAVIWTTTVTPSITVK